jgi:hypothetical protein
MEWINWSIVIQLTAEKTQRKQKERETHSMPVSKTKKPSLGFPVFAEIESPAKIW